MTDVAEDRDQGGAELSAADEQLPDDPKTRFSQPDQPTLPTYASIRSLIVTRPSRQPRSGNWTP